MLPCICSVIDHRWRQNVVRTSVTHSAIASCATFLFLPHFDVICDLLLNRCTATWNYLLNITQVNSAFRARWLASSEVISQVLFRAAERKTKWLPVSNKVTLWSARYSAWVEYTKTIIRRSGGEQWWILTSPLRGLVNIHHCSPPLRWMIVNYWSTMYVMFGWTFA